MAEADFTIDYRGARGSNTGDEYHELWTVRQALRLLDRRAGLSAITVEGMRAEDGADAVWDGVDCALFYGDTASKDAARVEIQQLKYSASNPKSPWTVARITTGRGGKSNTSPIRRLANAYTRLLDERSSKPSDTLTVKLVTNQPIDAALIAAIEGARNNVPPAYEKAWRKGGADLHRLVYASGLKPNAFVGFAKALDLQGNSGSRFASEDEMLRAIAKWSDVEFAEAASRLRAFVRARMLPEAAGEIIDRERVLIQFGVSDERALFPCPSAIRTASAPVPRVAVKNITNKMFEGKQYFCIHGMGGVGKTTVLQEISEGLPDGSVVVTFDCYGGGSYMDASALRHKAEDAFIQLSNELAVRLNIPLLLEPRNNRDYARAFRKRLDHAAETLRTTIPNALIVVAIDAADNSVTAAQERSPPDKSFVHEFVTFSNIPLNVRFIVSARTGRRDDLRLPHWFEEVVLAPFDRDETAANVERYWAAPDEWVDDFHHLSTGVPRVQAYAFDNAGDTPARANDALRPLGKKLDHVFRERFEFALSKAGRVGDLSRVCAGLITLARPIPINELAAVLDFDKAQVADICADLAPGVRNESDFLSFADEDFEAFVREAGQAAMEDVQHRTAARFLARAHIDPYAAFNVVPALLAAKRGKDLLDFVEQHPEPAVALVPDPVRRREVQLQRLLTAIKACRESGDPARALHFVLIGAEAIVTDTATRSLLADYPELTARYARETASRLILGDPERIEAHGALLTQLMAEDAAKGDAIAFREGRRRLHAWLGARDDDFNEQKQSKSHYAEAWPIDVGSGAAMLYAVLKMDGPAAVAARIRRFRPVSFALGSAKIFIERLLAEQRFEDVAALAAIAPPAWSVFALVPLAIAGRQVDLDRLARGLSDLKKRISINASLLGHSAREDKLGSYAVDIVLSGAEILAAKAHAPDIVKSVLAPFLDPELRRIDRRYDFETNHLDAILRSYCLAESIAGADLKAAEVLVDRPQTAIDSNLQKINNSHEKDHDRGMREFLSPILEYYSVRARAILGKLPSIEEFNAALGLAHRIYKNESWRFERRYSASTLRAKIAESLTLLVAAGIDADALFTHSLQIRHGIWAGGENGIGPLFTRFSSIQSIHGRLLLEITRLAHELRRDRTASEEKSRTLASYAKLLVPISSEDADAIFKNAIEAASELDSEAIDQIKFLARLIERSAPSMVDDASSMASLFAEIIHDAGIRLSGVEHFPWSEAFRGLAILDFPTALAASARWDDTDIIGLQHSLPATVATGLDAGCITVQQALSMLQLLTRADEHDLECVLQSADGNEAIAEELAHDAIGDRIASAKAVADFIARHAHGPWAALFKARQEFAGTLPPTPGGHLAATRPAIAAPPSVLVTQIWDAAILVDGKRLAESAEEVLQRGRAAGEYLSMADVLNHSRRTLAVSQRIAHLDALSSLFDRFSSHDVIVAIMNAIDEWPQQMAVASWCKSRMPELIAANLPGFAQYLPWRDSFLERAVSKTQANDVEIQTLLLDGIERNADSLSSFVTFSLAGEIACRLDSKQAAELCAWYIKRLAARVEVGDLEQIPANILPVTSAEAMARFFFAYLGDVDVRQRWRAAHALRRLARLDVGETLSLIVHERARRQDAAFRDPNAPYYWIAGKLWLIIALDRIALEVPNAVAPHADWLLEVALSSVFPHLLLRDFAADACRKLIAEGLLSLSAQSASDLEKVNCTALPIGTKNPSYGGSFDTVDRREGAEKHRFHFDTLDTLRYWYQPWLGAFEDLEPEEFLKAAEHWIVDIWGVLDEAPYGSKEPRLGRFTEHNWRLSHAGHGTSPTLERHRTYLEWHAMWCAAGDILKTHHLARPDYLDDDEFRQQITRSKLSSQNYWAADFVGLTPLEMHRWWMPDSDPTWFDEVSGNRFLAEMMPASREGYITVAADIDTVRGNRREAVRITSALAATETAPALVRALQTAASRFDYYLCPEGDSSEIDEDPYVLKGWLSHPGGDPGLDRKDVFSNGISRIETEPGNLVRTRFSLDRQLSTGCVTWMRPGSHVPTFIYEAWGGRVQDDSRSYSENTKCDGYRLLIRDVDLSELLTSTGFHLVAQVGITRRGESKRSGAHDEEEKEDAEFDRVFLVRCDGGLDGAERSFGTWYEDRPRAGASA